MLVTSFGLGLVFVPLSLVALHNVAEQDSGVASSLLNTGQQVGGAIGLAALGTIAWTTVADNLRNARAAIAAGRQPAQSPAQLAAHALATGFARGFLAAAAIALLALLIAIATIRVSRQELTGAVPASQEAARPGGDGLRLVGSPGGALTGDERGRLGAALLSFSVAEGAVARVKAALAAGTAPGPEDLAALHRATAALADAAGALGVDPAAATLAELEAQLAAREAALGTRRALRRLAGATAPGVGADALAGIAREASRLAAAPSWSPEDRVRSLTLARLVELADAANDDGDDERILALDAELRSSLGPAGAPVVLAGARGRLVLPDDRLGDEQPPQPDAVQQYEDRAARAAAARPCRLC
jgi:hypothetical protein